MIEGKSVEGPHLSKMKSFKTFIQKHPNSQAYLKFIKDTPNEILKELKELE